MPEGFWAMFGGDAWAGGGGGDPGGLLVVGGGRVGGNATAGLD